MGDLLDELSEEIFKVDPARASVSKPIISASHLPLKDCLTVILLPAPVPYSRLNLQ
ncbi:MAG: hypothetical protein LBS81_00325 [Endomicrobium sp.]|jgi:hypothetical protein|nr:hypothetical protein [Endomicrobium sp.]